MTFTWSTFLERLVWTFVSAAGGALVAPAVLGDPLHVDRPGCDGWPIESLLEHVDELVAAALEHTGV